MQLLQGDGKEAMKYILAMAVLGIAFLAVEHLLMEDNEKEAETDKRYDNQDLITDSKEEEN